MQIYKPSQYIFDTMSRNKTHFLVYNSITGAFGAIEASQKAKVQSIFSSKRIQADKFSPSVIKEFLSQGFIVKESTDELECLEKKFHKYANDHSRWNLIFLPAEACNFSCPYCFIYKMRNRVMEDWVYDAVSKYVDKKGADSRYIKLQWYGGEPLLQKEKIYAFMKKIKPIAERHQITLDSNLVTNGYLLDLKTMRQMLAHEVKTVQVTFDGDQISHDQLRYTKDKKGTFDVIFSNVIEIQREIEENFHLSIRINFTKDSIKRTDAFIDLLVEKFGKDPRFDVFFRQVHNVKTESNCVESIENKIVGKEQGRYLERKYLFEFLRKSNRLRKNSPLPKPIPSWCDVVKKETAFIIGAQGNVFKCDSAIGLESEIVGQLGKDGDISWNENLKPWTQYSVFQDKKCRNCKSLPICMGGCLRSRYKNGQSCAYPEKEVIESMKEYFEYIR